MIEIYVVLIALALLIIILARRGWINIALKKLQRKYELETRRKKRLQNSRSLKKRLRETEKERQIETISNTRRHLTHISSFLKKADLCISKGDIDEAIKLLISVLAIDEKHHKANELLSELYMNQKQFNKSEMIYRKLIEAYPNNPVYHTNLGHCFFNQKQFKEALSAYENAIRLDQHKPVRYANLAQAHLALGDVKQAIENLEMAHKLDKRNTQYLFLLAKSHLSFQDPIKAREYIHMVLELEPYNTDAKALLETVLALLNQ